MDQSCGISLFRPKWLRKFATVKSFMAVYGLLGTIQAMAFVYLVVTLTTMEKRFKIPSKTTGIILTGNEISQILLSLILSYHGAHRNRPRWIAWGVAFSALSCFIVALPHLIYGPGADALSLTAQSKNDNFKQTTLNTSRSFEDQICRSEEKSVDCNVQDRSGDFSIIPLVLVFFSQFILGIGNTLYFSLGQTYLDDNTSKTETPILLGWTLALRTLGPAVGFVLAYICLNVYIDPTKVPLIDKKDPRWLGAWWLGWILLGSIMFVFSFLVAMFPQYLPAAETKHLYPEEQNGFLAEATTPEIPKLKDFPVALKRLLKNKLLMYNNLSAVFYILGASGYITYISKYLEVQFQESATYTVITGPSMLVGMVAGFLISGYLITKYRPGPVYLLGWNVVVGIVFIIGQLIFIQLDCPITEVHSFSNNPKIFELNAVCNANCSCNNIKYSPVCDSVGQTTYFSPCHAGCGNVSENKLFTGCACAGPDKLLKDGPCLTDCYYYFLMFVLISFVINFMGSSGRIGNLLVNYRSVHIKDKSFAQGLALWMISLFALIPGPIIYGIIIDSSCTIWNDYCGKRGNCYTYDRRKMRVYLNSTAIILTALGVATDAVVWYLGRNLDLYDNKQITTKRKQENN
ncbi:PREDICTED: solute carrier organic anion transporter family member 4C1 [Nicrophorus vespilloides]|uniref:Solute carrier organic anion transporter family member n=1 Tax=Nicrophorus vespilloides TaxID=110193 RepID=A0ABM1MHX7_NICVS|nr:PREDICTED: solute carrier organic anion transporter family member 4C1 [Nicrophorus vespilloides]